MTVIFGIKMNKSCQVNFWILYISCFLIGSISTIDKQSPITSTISTIITTNTQDICGDYLTNLRGSINTPNFPNPFSVPIKCRWVIDASSVLSSTNNHSIVVYLTQLYVYKGLSFTEYAYYESENTNFEPTVITKITEGNVFKYRQLKTNRPFLVIEFELERIEGNHIRVLDHLLNVYGFNITYEITGNDNHEDGNINGDITSCSIQDCSFTGNCIIGANYRSFSCQCFNTFYGDKCENGPLCFDDNGHSICKNDGICNHVGSAAVTCHCKLNFTGSYCEIPIKDNKLTKDKCQNNEDICSFQCPASRRKNDDPCDCTEPIPIYNNRARFECRIKLSNTTLLQNNPSSLSLSSQISALSSTTLIQSFGTLEIPLKKQLIKYLRNSDIINVDDFKIINVTSSAEVTFHFYGISSEGDKIRDALNRLVQRRRLNDFILESTHFTFQQSPSLKLQSLGIINYANQRDVRLNDEFTISCTAQGSFEINFLWYKDNMLVNTSKSIRKMSLKRTISNDGFTYTSLLIITRASLLDKGQYTCQVIDWGMQHCKSIYVNVRDEPNVKIIPMSATVEKGSNIQLTCIPPNMNSLGIGFGWTKNRALLKLDPSSQVWEDLYPAGSILKIINIQKSAIFTCNVAHRSMSVRVDVVNRTLIPICRKEKKWNMNWPDTGPGSEAFLECPLKFTGNRVSRLCMMENSSTAMWQIPDFSECLYRPFIIPYTNFQRTTLGYQNISGLHPNTVTSFWEILQLRQFPLYPGEGDRILRILGEIEHYYRHEIKDMMELYNSAESFMLIINRILDDEYSIIRHYNQLLLQQLISRNLQYWIKELLIKSATVYNHNNQHHYLVLSSMILDIQPFHLLGHYDLEQLNNNQLFYFNAPIDDHVYSSWYGNNKVAIKILKHTNLDDEVTTLPIGAVILFKNITRYLPSTYVQELNDGTDFEYHFYSKVITVVTFYENGATNSDVQMEIIFHHLKQNRSTLVNVSCGVKDESSGNWDLNLCSTMPLFDQISTRCMCPTSSGTFALFLTTRAARVSIAIKSKPSTFIVLLGCTCGLLQTAIAFIILCYIFWKRRNWLNFLKLQFSIALVGIMIIFIYATYYTTLSETSFAIVAASLETLFLIGMSAPISQALIIYANLTQIRPSSQHFQPTIIAIITGLPILCVLTTELSHKSTGNRHETWWLTFGSGVYNIFISCVTTMVLLFILLYIGILRKLREMSIDHNNDVYLKKKPNTQHTVGTIHRTTVILCVLLLVIITSIIYTNSTNEVYHYAFASSSAFLGFTILSVYIGNREMILVLATVLCKFKWKSIMKKDLTSDPIKTCTKMSTDNDNAVPIIPLTNVAGLRTSALCKGPNIRTRDHDVPMHPISCSSVGASCMRKYINPIESEKLLLKSSTVQATGCYVTQINCTANNTHNYKLDDVNLETYSTSPRKYQDFHSNTFVCSESDSTAESNSHSKNFGPTEASSPQIVCCSADVESRNAVAMPDVTLATSGTDTAHTILNTVKVLNRERSVIPDIASSITEHVKSDYPHDNSYQQQEGMIVDDCEQNTSGMLDRISHDLDYLLNRTQAQNDE